MGKVASAISPYNPTKTDLLKTSKSWRYILRNPLALRLDENLIYYNDRLVLPQSESSELFTFLHKSHMGRAGMLREYRSFYFIPNFDKILISSYEACSKFRYTEKRELVHWVPSELPNERVYMDFGQIQNGHAQQHYL
uniref:F-box domain-containing protein n=1 Tax=Rhabditophanes sp. KR3021 TaxID=114890 RepID=A0AC35TPD6_9BILA